MSTDRIEDVGGRNDDLPLWLVVTAVAPAVVATSVLPYSYKRLENGKVVDWVCFFVLVLLVVYLFRFAIRLFRKMVRLLRELDKAQWREEQHAIAAQGEGPKVVCSVGYVDCPGCGASQMNFINDPRGGTYDCDSCGKPFHVPVNAIIDLN